MSTANTDQREIRIFLSSTFRDMEAERSYLLQHVFPRFRQDCAERNVGFTEIDLRWGITEQAAQNGQTVEICLSEIDRCRDYPPFFIGFLGERYGWVPGANDLDAYWAEHNDPLYAQAIRAALGQGISVTELEMRFGVLDHLHAPQAANAHFYLRDAGLSDRLARGFAPADFFDAGDGKLDALKQALRASGKIDLDGYTSVEAFGERVYQRLLEGLDQRYPAAQVPDERQQRAQEHARFAASRRRDYVPLPAMRSVVLDAITTAAATATATARPLYLSGPSGIGKSALMADLASWLPRQLPGAEVYARYSGADGNRALALWRDDLLAHLGGATANAASDDAARWQELSRVLSDYTAAHPGPLVLLLDAIDQLDDAAQALRQLAQQYWPPQVTLLVSGLPELRPAEGYTVLAQQVPDSALRGDIIHAFTEGYRKALAPALVTHLASAPAAASPLFLRMVLEELRVRSHHETLSADIDALLAQQQPDALFAHLLQRWDAVYSDASHPAIVSSLAGLLALSHAGLSETELADLLAAPHDPLSPETGKPRLPAARLSPLLGVLRPYLLRNAGLESLMHMALQRGALPPAPGAVRQVLIRHFPAWHWRHVTERLHQRLQLARADDGSGAALAALQQEISQLPAFFFLPRKERILMRDSLQLMDAGRAGSDTRAAHIGLAWGEQLRSIGDRSFADKAMHWLRRASGQDEVGSRLHWINELVEELQSWAYYTVAAPLAEQQVALLELRGNEAEKLGEAYHNRALLNMAMGKLDLAASQFERLMAFTEQTPALRHNRVLLLLNLCGLRQRQGQYQQARQLAEEVLALLRADPQAPLNHLASATEMLGRARISLGAMAEGVQLMEQAGTMMAQALPAGHPLLLTMMIGRAQAYTEASRFDEAEALYLCALEACRVTLTPNHPITAQCLTSLGALYAMLHRFSEAEPLMRQALAMHRAVYGGPHQEIVIDLTYFGRLCIALKRYEDADALLEEALDMVRSISADNVQALLPVLTVISESQLAQGHVEAAERYALQAVEAAVTRLPAEHQDRATVLCTLAEVYVEAGLHERAEQLLAEVLALRRRILPPVHNDIAASLEKLGELYLAASHPEAAEPLLQEALQIARSLSDTPTAFVGIMLMELGTVYLMQLRIAEAEEALLESETILRATPGAGPEALGNALAGLCSLYGSQQCWDAALRYGREAMVILRTLGPDAAQRAFNCLQILTLAPQPAEAALAWAEEALPLGRASLPDSAVPQSQMLQQAASLCLQLGRVAEMETHRAEDIALCRALLEQHDRASYLRLAMALGWLGIDRLKVGQAMRAIAPLEEALALLRAHATTAEDNLLMMVVTNLSEAYFSSQYKIGTAAALKQEAFAIVARLQGA